MGKSFVFGRFSFFSIFLIFLQSLVRHIIIGLGCVIYHFKALSVVNCNVKASRKTCSKEKTCFKKNLFEKLIPRKNTCLKKPYN